MVRQMRPTLHEQRLEAERLYAAGDLGASEETFRLLVDTPLRADGLLGLARIQLQRGNHASGEALLEQALGVRRRNADALAALAACHLAQGSRETAISLLGEALSYNPRHHEAFRTLISLARDTSTNPCRLSGTEGVIADDSAHSV